MRNAKDILLLHEEDAEEWALYLREIFMHVVEREAILLYPLHNLTSKKSQFLEKISTEQEPNDYISVIRQILDQEF
ncbi:B-cell scaffold protein with ankyrin repeats [Apodemus speciosus]|uniref:B-cell scaffold protein with ankyrin repeats n=1 Tax=Apodemus speciosus TaxID=105296 RepID=A0ABQ0EM31_APOSI